MVRILRPCRTLVTWEGSIPRPCHKFATWESSNGENPTALPHSRAPVCIIPREELTSGTVILGPLGPPDASWGLLGPPGAS